jgi:hypothetical protein
MSLHLVRSYGHRQGQTLPLGHDGVVDQTSMNKLQYAKEHSYSIINTVGTCRDESTY